MCGVAGAVHFLDNGELGFSIDKVSQEFEQGLRSRGPDGFGIFVSPDKNYFFVHTRLAITDLTILAKQPMISSCDRYIITFNGEIYNQKELAEKYLFGFHLCTESDTEVLLEVFARVGPRMFSELEGIFAIAIFDKFTRELWLAKDHLGIKPLYFFHDESQKMFSFASSAKLLAQVFDQTSFDPVSVELFKLFGSVPSEQSFYKNIFSFPAGFFFKVSCSGIEKNRYHYTISYLSSSFSKQKLDLETCLIDVIQSQVPTKVPFGVFLSAGIDSSLLTVLLKRLGYDFFTFTIGFEENISMYKNEAVAAKKFAQRLGTQHQEWIITKKEVKDLFTQYIALMDQPSSDGFNVFVASKLAAGFCKVVFSGLGADEIFLGYWHHKHFWNFSNLQHLWYKKILYGLGSFASVHRYGKSVLHRAGYSFLNHTELQTSALKTYLWFRSLEQKFVDYPRSFDELNEIFEEDQFSDLQKLILAELYFYDQYKLLRDADTFGMASGIEIRVPFLDKRIISFGLSQANIKTDSQYLLISGKKQLLALLRNFDSNYSQISKQGFELPLDQWLFSTPTSQTYLSKLVKEVGEKFQFQFQK